MNIAIPASTQKSDKKGVMVILNSDEVNLMQAYTTARYYSGW